MELCDPHDNEEIDGLIQRIQVKNFLCHDNLIIDFNNSNINWVIGRNGSGKSAILAALVVGLGGKAAATKRGSNIQSFIKTGTNFAIIEIKIKNNTQRAYNHDKYGDFITVIRRITTAGASQYTVKSASGNVISTKYSEINKILLAHEIQVDNPISILNQDEARTFSSTDPKRLYSLFRRATNLDDIESNYHRVMENCKIAVEIKEDKEKTCAELEKEYKKWENKYRRLMSRDEMKVQINALKNELLWSDIAVLKKQHNILNGQIELQRSKCRKISEKIMSMNDDFGNNTNIIDTLMSRLRESDSIKASLEQEKMDVEEELRNVQEKHRSAQRAAAKKQERLNKERKKIVDFEREIENIKSGSDARRRSELARAAQEARAALAELEARLSTAEHHAAQARGHAERAQDDARRHAALDAELQDRLGLLQRRRRELKARAGDPLATWGAPVAELCRRLARQRRQFSEPPVGPVGHYLRIKDPKWASALEHIIGNLKTSFCVNTAADSRKLFEIMQEVFGNAPKPSVTCSRFQRERYDVSQRRVRAQPCALDVLDVSHPVVANFLIDALALETVLLVPDQERAIRLADSEENVPANCSKIVTEDCTEFYPAPNYRSYGRDARRAQHHYLQAGTEEAERRLREDEAAAAEEKLARAGRAEEARRAAAAAVRASQAAERSLLALQNARLQRERELRAAQRALELHHSPQHDELEKELDVSRQTVESLKLEMDEATRLENEHAQKIIGYENSIKELRLKFVEAAKSSNSLREEITKKQLEIDNWKAKRENYERILSENQASLARIEGQLEQEQTVISGKVQHALAAGPCVEKPRDRAVLQELLSTTSAKLKAVDDLQLDLQQVQADRQRAHDQFHGLRDLLDRFGALILELQAAVEKRLEFCYELEKQMLRRVQYCFASNLATHGYNGRVEAKRAARELRLELWARDGRRAAGVAAALSGGERSYCTVALLLAFWECVKLPFYFLDEFDVFMDPVNRKITVELLLDFARRRPSRQFVLLSPHAPQACALPPPARVHVHRLEDPQRNKR